MKKQIFIFFTFIISNIFGQNNGSIELDQKAFLNWEIQNFIKENHTYKFCLQNKLKYLCKIDNQEWYGSDRGIEFPKNELTKLEVIINNNVIKLETSKMFNPSFSGELFETQFKLKKKKDYYILFAYFSDGAGTYSAHWKIINGKSERIVLSNEEEYFEWQIE
jgi:hypothetical protein